MARKFVSPGVFTQEIDKSYLAQGVASIGAAVIGTTAKGPAFSPVVITDFNEFVAKFGDIDPTRMMPYAAKNYLKNSNTLNVVRVLGSRDGSNIATNGDTAKAFAILDSGLTASAIVVYPSAITPFITGSSSGSDFRFSFTSGATVLSAGTASMNPTAQNYIGKMFNTDPTKISQYGNYLYKNFEWYGTGTGFPFTSATLSGVATTGVFDCDYASGQTPWIKSQPFGTQVYSLFQFVAVGGGNASNVDIKVTIANIKPSTFPTVTKFGTFDVIVRTFSDTDSRLTQIESFTQVTLDPTSQNYLPRMIGDQYIAWNSTTRKNVVTGIYKNRSKYIRVVMGTGNPPEEALPWGHSGYPEAITAGGDFPTAPLVADNIDSGGNLTSYVYFGLDLSQAGVADRLAWTLKSGSSYNPANTYTAADDDFSLVAVSGTSSAGVNYAMYSASYTGTLPTTATLTGNALAAQTAAQHGFTVAFYGGFDGWDPSQADPLALAGANNTVATVALKQAIDTLSNPDEIDLNLLAIPGVIASSVNTYARDMCNNRADCMMIMDIVNSSSVGSVTSVISSVNGGGYDDNYAATYYPCLKYADQTNNTLVTVPPSVAVLGAYAFSDRVGQVFFAPAGLNRGGLAQFGIVDVLDRLTFQDRNDLYEARINPIATFPNEGINVFGQKTLQARPSALDRVNVRRLLIYAKKTIASVAKTLLFEPNNPATWQRFLATVNPIMEKIRQDQGIERFKVVMDSTTNTSDLIDRNIMTGKIFLQPTRSAEFIDLSFIITATGVAFEE
jgi:hypothetical protein